MTSTTLRLLVAPEASASASSATNRREPRFVVGTGRALDQLQGHLQDTENKERGPTGGLRQFGR